MRFTRPKSGASPRGTATHRITRRDGFALAAALLGMVVIGAAVTAGFYAAAQQDRMSTSVAGARDAFYVADQGVQAVIGTWSGANYPAAVGDSLILTDSIQSAGRYVGRYRVTVRKIDDYLYTLVSAGRTINSGHASGAVRTVGQIVRLTNFTLPTNSALYMNGGNTVSGNAVINGNDLDAGSCNEAGIATVPGIIVPDASQVIVEGSSSIMGSPAVEEDNTMTSSSLLTYDNSMTFDSLAARASLKFPTGVTFNQPQPNPSGTTGTCNLADTRNFGDPRIGYPCSDYYPMVYIKGNTNFTGGSGQGVLLVDGDLSLSGGFTYDGIVITKGTLTATGTGAHIEGVVIVNNGQLDLGYDPSFTAGNSTLQYSSCNAKNALNGGMKAAPILTRSWFDLTGSGLAN